MRLRFTQEALCEALLTETGKSGSKEDASILYSRQEGRFLVWCPDSGIEAWFDSFEAAVIYAVRLSLTHEPRYPA